ncbi:hypothetical protein Bca101_011895 [Brassica carinata]
MRSLLSGKELLKFFLVRPIIQLLLTFGLSVASLVNSSLKWCFECISEGCDFVFMMVCLFEFEQLKWSGGKLFSLVILSFSNCFISLGTLTEQQRPGCFHSA